MKLITEITSDICVAHFDDRGREIKNIDRHRLGKSTNTLHIRGVFAQADIANKNGRIYPKHVLEKAVDEYNKEFISNSRSLGELNHPDDPTVNPERACILIKELKFDGSNVIGRAKVLSTPHGLIVRKLLEDGVQLGVSTRGLGSLKKSPSGEDVYEVDEDYTLQAIDVVHAPSGPSCFVNGILENVEFSKVGKNAFKRQAFHECKKHCASSINKELEILAERLLRNMK
jgi:hypothetical protein